VATITQRGNRWRVQIRRKGHRPISKTITKKQLAEQWARENEHAIDAGRYRDTQQADKLTLQDCCEWHLLNILPVRESSSHVPDRARIRTLISHLGTYTLSGLTLPAVLAFVDDRLPVVSADAIRKELQMLADVIDTARAVRQIYLPVNVAREARAILRKLRKLPAGQQRERRLSPGEYEKLTTAAHSQPTCINEIIILAVETGMRQGELAAARREHIDHTNRVIYVPKSKSDWITGKKGRVVPLSTKALAVLDALPAQLNGSLFGMRPDSIKRAFDRLCEHQAISGLRFHDLRHEAISRFFERGFSIQEVAAVSGHRDWRSLKRYTHPDAILLAARLA